MNHRIWASRLEGWDERPGGEQGQAWHRAAMPLLSVSELLAASAAGKPLAAAAFTAGWALLRVSRLHEPRERRIGVDQLVEGLYLLNKHAPREPAAISRAA